MAQPQDAQLVRLVEQRAQVGAPGWSALSRPSPIVRRRVREGQVVFRQGQRCDYLYAVRRGSFKSVSERHDGREQVIGFHLPGELFGFDGLATGMHPSTARALEDAEVCVLPCAALREAAGESPAVRECLTSALSAELVRERQVAWLIANTLTQQRVAAFLCDLSQRLHVCAPPSQALRLRLTRAEIGSHLGTTLETVSRCLSSLARQGLVKARRRQIEIVDIEGLRANGQAACGSGPGKHNRPSEGPVVSGSGWGG